MGQNEIRIRRNMMSTGRIARHRNYSELMRQHDRDTKLKRILKVFTYFLIILFITLILIIVIRWERRKTSKSSQAYIERVNNASSLLRTA
jgi:preprotein translocase subunit SecG